LLVGLVFRRPRIPSEHVIAYSGTLYTRPVSNEQDTRKLNAIVGAALRGLVDAGATDEAIGAFAHDHRARVAELLGVGAAAQSAEIDLTVVVQRVLQELGAAPARVGRKPAARVVVQVRGSKTSISIQHSLLDRLVAARGGEKTRAVSTIEELANAAPASVANRSRWVAQRVEAILQAPVGNEAGSPARH
jgi:hypothetical protein